MSSDDEETAELRKGGNKRAKSTVVCVNGVAKRSRKDLFQPSVFPQQSSIGKVVKVRLINFMCHSNLLFTFGDKVNFISGRNGSGKSAILTALVIGLGGRMSDTNRGTNLTKLLKNGEQKGSIEITLSNQGPLAYDPEKYGNEITIVRNFSESNSTYKILSERGEVVSTKKRDIQFILISFNIQASNPVAILNQDTARTFLSKMQPKELYTIFRKGTLIDELEDRLEELTRVKLPRIQALIKQKKKAADDSAAELIMYSESIKKFKKLLEHQNEFENVQYAVAWIYVSELERVISSVQEQKTESEMKIDQLRQSMESREGAEADLSGRLAAQQQELLELTGRADELDQGTSVIEQDVTMRKNQLKLKAHDIKKLQKKIDSEMERCKQLQAEINNSQSRSAEVEAKRAEILRQRAELKQRYDELKAVIATTETHKQQVSDTYENISKRYEQAERFANNTLNSLRHKTQYLNSLEKATDELHVFSEWMPSLVAAIEKAWSHGKFEHKPRGPLGRYIKLVDESWGPAVEKYIGDFVLSFAVGSTKDSFVMHQIFDHCHIAKDRRPPVIVTSFENTLYDIRQSEVNHPKYMNLFRSIEISDPVVANLMIDLNQPDTVLLVPTSRETYPIADDARNVPENCKTFLNKDGTRIFPAPKYRVFSGRVAERSRYLQVSPEQAIRMTKLEIERLQIEYDKSKAAVGTLKRELREEQTKLDTLKKELHQLQRKKSVCETKMEEAELIELPESYDDGILANDLEYRRKLMETTKSELEERIKEKEQIAETIVTTESSFKEKEAQKLELRNKISETKQAIETLKSELRKYNRNHNHFKESLKMEMARKVRIDEKLDKLQKDLSEALKVATDMCSERIVTDESKEVLEKKLTDLGYTIKALKKDVGTKEPPQPANFLAREQKHEETIRGLRAVHKSFRKLKKEHSKLQILLENTTKLVYATTRAIFQEILGRRSFKGDLIINEEKKELKLVVKPDPTENGNTVISTLSGGERSYSMVAFLLSIWRNMSTPFYILDEFDVYMDEVNRKLVMDLLMSHARQFAEKQFIFLTPHATSDRSVEDVHFFRMEDPRK